MGGGKGPQSAAMSRKLWTRSLLPLVEVELRRPSVKDQVRHTLGSGGTLAVPLELRLSQEYSVLITWHTVPEERHQLLTERRSDLGGYRSDRMVVPVSKISMWVGLIE